MVKKKQKNGKRFENENIQRITAKGKCFQYFLSTFLLFSFLLFPNLSFFSLHFDPDFPFFCVFPFL